MLWKYEVPANVLTTTARGIRITVRFHGADNPNRKTFKLYFGSTNVVLSGGPVVENGLTYEWTCEVIRTALNTQVLIRDQFDSSASGRRPALPLSASEAEAVEIPIRFTGQSDTPATNDIVFDYAKIEALN